MCTRAMTKKREERPKPGNSSPEERSRKVTFDNFMGCGRSIIEECGRDGQEKKE